MTPADLTATSTDRPARHQALNKKTVAVKSVIWYDYSNQLTDLQPLSPYLFLGVYSL